MWKVWCVFVLSLHFAAVSATGLLEVCFHQLGNSLIHRLRFTRNCSVRWLYPVSTYIQLWLGLPNPALDPVIWIRHAEVDSHLKLAGRWPWRPGFKTFDLNHSFCCHCGWMFWVPAEKVELYHFKSFLQLLAGFVPASIFPSTPKKNISHSTMLPPTPCFTVLLFCHKCMLNYKL